MPFLYAQSFTQVSACDAAAYSVGYGTASFTASWAEDIYFNSGNSDATLTYDCDGYTPSTLAGSDMTSDGVCLEDVGGFDVVVMCPEAFYSASGAGRASAGLVVALLAWALAGGLQAVALPAGSGGGRRAVSA